MEKRRIIVNIICSLLLQVVTIVSGFILPKIIISSLGSETNGLVASINQFLNYVVLLEGGVSKRSCELLLRSYVDEYNINAVICRLPSVYGPTMLKSDSKAHGQFIKNALNKENIVLKSKGEQRRTYSYVVDVVSGIFKVLFNGLNGEVYNIANENSIASIAEVASICAEIAGTNVVFDLPDKIEKKGFSQSKDCILDNSKLKSLGWNGKYTLKQGLVETIESLREDE